MAIDSEQLSESDAEFVRRILPGYAAIEAKHLRPKRKQQGRGENQLERDFEANIRAKPWLKFWSKPFILRIGAGRTFEPDAMVLDHDHTWVIDTKGPWTDGDSRLKICMAASQYSHWRWLIVTRPDGTWKAKEVSPLKGIGRRFIELPWLN